MFRGDLLIMKLSEEEYKGLGKPPPGSTLAFQEGFKSQGGVMLLIPGRVN